MFKQCPSNYGVCIRWKEPDHCKKNKIKDQYEKAFCVRIKAMVTIIEIFLKISFAQWKVNDMLIFWKSSIFAY